MRMRRADQVRHKEQGDPHKPERDVPAEDNQREPDRGGYRSTDPPHLPSKLFGRHNARELGRKTQCWCEADG